MSGAHVLRGAALLSDWRRGDRLTHALLLRGHRHDGARRALPVPTSECAGARWTVSGGPLLSSPTGNEAPTAKLPRAARLRTRIYPRVPGHCCSGHGVRLTYSHVYRRLRICPGFPPLSSDRRDAICRKPDARRLISAAPSRIATPPPALTCTYAEVWTLRRRGVEGKR